MSQNPAESSTERPSLPPLIVPRDPPRAVRVGSRYRDHELIRLDPVVA